MSYLACQVLAVHVFAVWGWGRRSTSIHPGYAAQCCKVGRTASLFMCILAHAVKFQK